MSIETLNDHGQCSERIPEDRNLRTEKLRTQNLEFNLRESVRHTLVGALAIGLLAAGLAGGRPSAQSSALTARLDRYLRGDFEAVAAELKTVSEFGDLLNDLKREGPGWISAAPAAEQSRCWLAAATFALEAARAAEREEWEPVQRVDLGPTPQTSNEGKFLPPFSPADALWWKPPPLLIEWGCALVRQDPAAQPIRTNLAPRRRRRRATPSGLRVPDRQPVGRAGNPEDEVNHLKHALARFPNEPRFALAQAIAVEWRTWPTAAKRKRTSARNLPDAMRAFEGQTKDATIGAEATLRLGAVRLRGRNLGGALELFARFRRRRASLPRLPGALLQRTGARAPESPSRCRTCVSCRARDDPACAVGDDGVGRGAHPHRPPPRGFGARRRSHERHTPARGPVADRTARLTIASGLSSSHCCTRRSGDETERRIVGTVLVVGGAQPPPTTEQSARILRPTRPCSGRERISSRWTSRCGRKARRSRVSAPRTSRCSTTACARRSKGSMTRPCRWTSRFSWMRMRTSPTTSRA